jgi:hypothetical protein
LTVLQNPTNGDVECGGTNPGAPKSNSNAWKHGGRSGEALAASRYLRMSAMLMSDAGC